MLSKLSIRNAKRQFKDYTLYFVTLVCTISFMYAFNALIFSDRVKSLPNLDVLPFMIVAASLLIIVIMGWIISYMTNYMLKKRSREFSIYMISGISNREIGTLVFYENILIGLLACLPGLFMGIFLSQLLEAVLLHMFGMRYTLHFSFSLSTMGLTFVYFGIMLLFSLRKNSKWIRKVKLYDLLLFDRKNEKSLISGSMTVIGIFFLSLFLGCAGLLLMYVQPLGSGYDALAGVICLVLFLFGFFLSVPTFLVSRFGNRNDWKFRKNRLVIFRRVTAKIQSTSIAMGMLSVVFLLSLTFMGIGLAICAIAEKNIELSVFDIIILHRNKLQDYSVYDDKLHQNDSIQVSHNYGIYTDEKQDFLMIRNKTILETGRTLYSSPAEFQYDTCMKQSDYIRLREMLGYEPVELNPSVCYVHCVPALKENFRIRMEQGEKPECAGYPFAAGGIFSEPFSQTDTYGNGLDYVIVVPDQAVNRMKVLYSMYVAITEIPLNSCDIQRILEICGGIPRLQRNVMRSAAGSDAATSLLDDLDYFSGKWTDKESQSQLYVMSICLFYLAFILEITGAAILATQILSDRDKKLKQDSILRQLGMNERLIARQNNRYLTQIFLLPMLPALLVGSCFVSVSAIKMQMSAFRLPVFKNNLWIAQAFVISCVFFAMLYGIYYIAAQISYGRQHQN